MKKATKFCIKCKHEINDIDFHKIVMYVVQDKFTQHHYEHVDCPGRFGI